MANNVYRGSDGSISLATDAGAEGERAAAIGETYSLTPIGRVTDVTVHVQTDLKPFHELGQRLATELRPGNVNVFGRIKRAFINGALLKLMLGEAADSRPAGTFVSPAFNLSLRLQNPSLPDSSATVTVMGVKIEDWVYTLPEDDFVMEEVRFRALSVTVTETP
ncbi:MAG TPA: hypothetical protein VLB76_12190 [Thermoanaerobaculia bacterium]|jgi:hypothetical protein|nr:hypothetical protein [Thermoanaerobaculia bacterium]